MYYIGIDPGLKGAMAIINDNNAVILLEDLPTTLIGYSIRAVYSALEEDALCVVEDVCGRPGQSCIANTTFMKYAGYAELLGQTLVEVEQNFYKVKPQIWKKYFGLITKGLTKTERKHLSIDLAKQFFPDRADVLTASKDGRAEALLLAKYCKEVYGVQHKQELLRDFAQTITSNLHS